MCSILPNLSSRIYQYFVLTMLLNSWGRGVHARLTQSEWLHIIFHCVRQVLIWWTFKTFIRNLLRNLWGSWQLAGWKTQGSVFCYPCFKPFIIAKHRMIKNLSATIFRSIGGVFTFSRIGWLVSAGFAIWDKWLSRNHSCIEGIISAAYSPLWHRAEGRALRSVCAQV